MPAIGITGGIATGKTAFRDCLRQLLPAARFFDADAAARELSESDPEVKREIAAAFGATIYSGDGHLNRAEVRAIVFADPSKKSTLEGILHPRIRRQWSVEAETYHHSPDFFFADIPLLYETAGESLCDRVVVVACSFDVQLGRLLQRGRIPARPETAEPLEPGAPLDEQSARQMINSQMRLEEKIKRADHVVWNNGSLSVLAEQAQLLVSLWQR